MEIKYEWYGAMYEEFVGVFGEENKKWCDTWTEKLNYGMRAIFDTYWKVTSRNEPLSPVFLEGNLGRWCEKEL
jgi:hypothetical protein